MNYTIILFILANLYDYILTQCGLGLNGVTEWNPVALVLIRWLGNIVGLMVFKVVIVSIIISASIICSNRYAKVVKFALNLGSLVIFLGGSFWLRYL